MCTSGGVPASGHAAQPKGVNERRLVLKHNTRKKEATKKSMRVRPSKKGERVASTGKEYPLDGG